MFQEFITFLGTKDLKKTSDFYQKILGLTIYKDQKVCLIFNVNTQSKIGFCTHMSVLHKKMSPIITFVADDVDKVYERITQYGIDVPETPRINQKFNIYHFFFKDPNGYTIEIQKFLEQ
jgi:predicted enzyme related to lactoylglutathione lyase